jgi:hypothetical protein
MSAPPHLLAEGTQLAIAGGLPRLVAAIEERASKSPANHGKSDE